MSTSLETIDGSCKFYRVEVKGLKTIVTYVSSIVECELMLYCQQGGECEELLS